MTGSIFADLKESVTGQEVHGIEFLSVIEEERSENGVRLSVRHKETSGHPTSLKLDLSFRELPLAKPILKPILNPYGYDLPTCEVHAMALGEMLAEKVRALIARGAPRDVYDVWFLLRNDVRFNGGSIAAKLKVLKRDNVFETALFLSRVEEKREEWKRDLNPLLMQVPDFDQIRHDIEKAISAIGT